MLFVRSMRVVVPLLSFDFDIATRAKRCSLISHSGDTLTNEILLRWGTLNINFQVSSKTFSRLTNCWRAIQNSNFLRSWGLNSCNNFKVEFVTNIRERCLNWWLNNRVGFVGLSHCVNLREFTYVSSTAAGCMFTEIMR